MATNFPTAPPAYGLYGPSAAVTVEKSLHASHTEILTPPRLKKARYRYRSFSPNEDSRLSAIDAIRQVGTSSGVLICLQNETVDGSRTNNIRALFVAGLAHGLGKPTLILAPPTFDVPLDVRDDAKIYRHPDDIVEYIATLSLEITEYQRIAFIRRRGRG